MNFSVFLKKERQEKGLSLRSLAELSGISKDSIRKYESCAMEPTIGAANAICKAFGMTLVAVPISGKEGKERHEL